MDLKHYLAQSPRGTLVDLAAQIGAHVPDVCTWAKGRRPVPAHRAVAIERATGGAVTRKDLRPDDYGDIWPELVEDKTRG